MSHRGSIIVALLLVATFEESGVTAPQRLTELARAVRPTWDGKPLLIPASPADYAPTTIEAVLADAIAVVQATLVRGKTYLDSSENVVVTDYAILSPTVIAGSLRVLPASMPGPTAPLTLGVFGGDVVVEGVAMRAINQNFEPIKDRGEYLVFLRPGRPPAPGRYEVYYGAIFEVSQDTARPLLRNASEIFKGTADSRLQDLVERIKRAAPVR